MTDTTRRNFLAAAGMTTAAGVVAATVGSGRSQPATAVDEKVALPGNAHGAMVAYVHDVRAGEMALMVEDREVVLKDKSLAAGLARAFARASG